MGFYKGEQQKRHGSGKIQTRFRREHEKDTPKQHVKPIVGVANEYYKQ